MLDQIYYNGTIFLPQEGQKATALALKNGLIWAISSIKEEGVPKDFRPFASEKTEIHNLEGNYLYPGFIDSHIHLFGVGLKEVRVKLDDLTSPDQLIQKVSEWKLSNESSEWILGRGWDQNKWKVKEMPHYEVLGELGEHHPIYLVRVDGHAALASKKALELAKITSETPNPAGGIIVKDKKSGEPTGILIDTAMDLVRKLIPIDGPEVKEKMARKARHEFVKKGVTTAIDAGFDIPDIPLIRENKGCRLAVMIDGATYLTLNQEDDKTTFLEAAVQAKKELQEERDTLLWEKKSYPKLLPHLVLKFYADGALGSKGALLKSPYEGLKHCCDDQLSPCGVKVISDDHLKEVIISLFKKNLGMAIHTLGDGAVCDVLSLFEIIKETFIKDGIYKSEEECLAIWKELRLRLEHLEVVDPIDLPHLSKLKIISSMQGIHYSDDMPWLKDRLGEERIYERVSLWKSMIAHHIPFAMGSDAPIASLDPLDNLYALTTRLLPDGSLPMDWSETLKRESLNEKLSPFEAIMSMTLGGAYSIKEEQSLGSIEVGKVGDFALFDQDIEEILSGQNPSALFNCKLLRTYIGGVLEYSNECNKI